MDKKGIEFSTLAEIIIVMVVALILIAAVVRFAKDINKESPIEICRLSILANSKAHQAALAILNTANLDLPVRCPAIVQKIEGKTVLEQYSKVAEDVRNCWYKMGEGNLKIFGTDIFGKLFSGNEYKRLCVICSEFTVSDNLQMNDLSNFMSTTKMIGKDMTYKQYLSKDVNALFMSYLTAGKFEPIATGLDKSKTYISVFYRVEVTKAQSLIEEQWFNVNIPEEQGMIVMPKEDLAKSGRCTKLFWQKQ